MGGDPNPLADMDRGGPNPLADLDPGVQIRGGSKSAVTPAVIQKRIHFQIVYWTLVFVGKIVCGIFCARIKPYEASRGKNCLQWRSFLYQKPL